MQTHSSSSNDTNIESADKNSVSAEKKKLLQEIQQLECIIEQYEWKLETLHFADVEEHVSKSQSREIPPRPRKIPNIEVDLQNDLYNFAGFRCVKCRKNELVFNFISMSEQQKKEIYAVQIFIKDGKGQLGKWIMPMSIDMNEKLNKIPINNGKNLAPFLKSCKHDIDCYTIRQEQFLSLKKHISHMKHCVLHSNMGYMQIVLELYGVHDRENDRYLNLIIYLLYHSDNARPHKINVDTMEENKLSNDLKQRLKIYLNEFKRSDLQTAFDKIITENSEFIWMQITNNEESSLESNDTSSSENFLKFGQKRKSKRKRDLQKKGNEKKKQKNTTNIKSSENNDRRTQAKLTHAENPQRVLIREKEIETVPSTSKQQEKVYKNLPEETPLYKPKVRFKQTKLNFETNPTASSTSSTNENSLFVSKLHTKSDKKKPKVTALVTSTPLTHRFRKNIKVSSLPNFDVTDITTSKETTDKFKDVEDSHVTNKKIVKRKTQKSSRGTTKSIGSRTVKTNQRRNIKNKNKMKDA